MFRNRLSLISWVLFACVAADQATKVMAISWLKGRPPLIYFGGLFRFEFAENPGAFLSLGATLDPDVRYWILTILVAAFLLAFMIYLFVSSTMSRYQTFALSLVLGGGISNLIDRVFRINGRVIDFMNLGVGSLRTGIFNIADMAIMAGVGLLFLTYAKKDVDVTA